MVAKGFAQRVAAVMSLEMDRPAPGLDQAVYRRDRQDLATLTEEKRGMIQQRCRGQQLMDCADRRLVQRDPSLLAGLLFLQGDLVAGLAVPDLADGDPEQVRGPQVGIDAQDKKAEVAGGIGQHLFDGPDIPDLTDGLDLDGGIFFRVVGVSVHGFCSGCAGMLYANL